MASYSRTGFTSFFRNVTTASNSIRFAGYFPSIRHLTISRPNPGGLPPPLGGNGAGEGGERGGRGTLGPGSPSTSSSSSSSKLSDFSKYLSRQPPPQRSSSSSDPLPSMSFLDIGTSADGISGGGGPDEEYHLHIYSTKHNTHITFTDPKKQPIISVACGNLGFKKSQRGTYDAAYQLAAHVFTKLQDKMIRPKALEVLLRGFGEGREAVVKALLGTEGRHLKGAIKRVTDSTRLKFGGTRSRNPRRLG